MTEYPNSFVDGYGRRIYTCKRCGRIFTPKNRPGMSGPSTLYCNREDCRKSRASAYMRERRKYDRAIRAVARLEKVMSEVPLDSKTAAELYDRILNVQKRLKRKANNES